MVRAGSRWLEVTILGHFRWRVHVCPMRRNFVAYKVLYLRWVARLTPMKRTTFTLALILRVWTLLTLLMVLELLVKYQSG